MTSRCALIARDRFLGYHATLRGLVGDSYREYKTFEPDRLEKAFDSILRSKKTGRDFVCYMVHRLSWDQALPNINHRTTLAFTHAMLAHNGLDAPWVDAEGPLHHPATEAWMRVSKAVMADREMWIEDSSAWDELKEKQFEATSKWIHAAAQSGKLAYAGPHFLRNFLSCSVK